MGKRDIDLIVEQALGIAEKLSKLRRARSATSKVPDLTEAAIVLLNVLAKRSERPVSLREVLKETGFSPSRLSKVIRELESRKRLIRSQRVEGDRDTNDEHLHGGHRGFGDDVAGIGHGGGFYTGRPQASGLRAQGWSRNQSGA